MTRLILYDSSEKDTIKSKYLAVDGSQDWVFNFDYSLIGVNILCRKSVQDDAKILAVELGIKLEETKPETSVVNVKVAFIRPEYDNLKEWMAGEGNVYIGRKGIVFITSSDGNKERYPKTDSIWANPFKVESEDKRSSAIEQYETYIRGKLASGEISRDELEKLRNCTLGCWCRSSQSAYEPDRTRWDCHGFVILQLLHETEVE